MKIFVQCLETVRLLSHSYVEIQNVPKLQISVLLAVG